MSNKEFYAEGDINSNAKGSGARANKGKVSFSMVPFHLLAGVARVFMGGKLKYAAWNWTKGMKWSSCFDCTCRHLFKWWYLGEDMDPDSGEHHLDHVLCNIFMLKHYTKSYLEGDDRPPKAITGFDDWMEDMMTLFDEDAFLERNPDIKALIEERKLKEKRDQMLVPVEDALAKRKPAMSISEAAAHFTSHPGGGK
jgi:hypothetical protein